LAASVQTYLDALAPDARAALDELRAIVTSIAPDATESITYGMPTFKLHGQRLAHVAAWKGHTALYGMNLTAHPNELAGYETSKGTVKFPLDKPIPADLVRLLIKERLTQLN
jgi:uncharacterized protein YdhG (YjbR/CyaY superfamily)